MRNCLYCLLPFKAIFFFGLCVSLLLDLKFRYRVLVGSLKWGGLPRPPGRVRCAQDKLGLLSSVMVRGVQPGGQGYF